jgi:protocatechuate 3,4-dioxygenase beta subunit
MKPPFDTVEAKDIRLNRRCLFTRLASGILVCSFRPAFAEELWIRPGAFAEELTRTPTVEEGPFYPYHQLPLDQDNDLIIVNNAITPAVGEVTNVSGRILDVKGDPIRNANVEIWQVDHNAIYLAERGRVAGFDANFQGYGRFQTASDGGYRFRTIKPVPYHSRPAPHIHFKVTVKGRQPWTTQLFIKGYPGNRRDGVYGRIGDKSAQDLVTVDFAPLKNSRVGELAARFDIVLDFTPEG